MNRRYPSDHCLPLPNKVFAIQGMVSRKLAPDMIAGNGYACDWRMPAHRDKVRHLHEGANMLANPVLVSRSSVYAATTPGSVA